MYDKEDSTEHLYERREASATPYIVLAVLVAVVGLIAGLAWMSA